MTKENLLKLLHAIADKKDVEFFDSENWLSVGDGWEGMSQLLFYIKDVSSNCINYRIKPEPKLVPFTFEDKDLFKDKWFKFGDSISRIQYINKTGIHVGANHFNWIELLNQAKFEDGSPCGKYINE